jgi:hypothetical protein
MTMGTGWILLGFVIVCVVFFRRRITGLLLSPREAGIYYLSDLLLKQHGYPHGTVPRAALEKLIDMQLEIAEHSVGSGSIARKTYLAERLPGLATQIAEWIEGDPRVDETWRRIFSSAGVPRHKRS